MKTMKLRGSPASGKPGTPPASGRAGTAPATGRPGPRRRWRRLRVVLLSIGGVVLVGALVWLVLFSSVFALRTVEVQGTSLLTVEDVLRQADAPLGVPLARVSEREIAQRVAELPAVDRVTVRRKMPDRLQILVAERVPVFAVGTGAEVTLVDASGATFLGPRNDQLLTGNGSLSDPTLLAGVADVVKALPPDLRNRAERVTFASRDAITVQLTDGVEIFFGSAEQAQLKAEVALALVRNAPSKRINVSAPTHPTTR